MTSKRWFILGVLFIACGCSVTTVVQDFTGFSQFVFHREILMSGSSLLNSVYEATIRKEKADKYVLSISVAEWDSPDQDECIPGTSYVDDDNTSYCLVAMKYPERYLENDELRTLLSSLTNIEMHHTEPSYCSDTNMAYDFGHYDIFEWDGFAISTNQCETPWISEGQADAIIHVLNQFAAN